MLWKEKGGTEEDVMAKTVFRRTPIMHKILNLVSSLSLIYVQIIINHD